MTVNEWAIILSGLQDDDEERKIVLLALSDEDFLSERGREFLRGRLDLHPASISFSNRDGENSTYHYTWGNALFWIEHPGCVMHDFHSNLPQELFEEMRGKVMYRAMYYPDDPEPPKQCWVDLLERLSL